jgi:hypothetical protein
MKTMNIAVWALSFVGLSLIAPASKAEGHYMSGSFCKPSSNNSGNYSYGQYGIQRNDTTDPRNTADGSVTCPIDFNYSVGKKISHVLMTVYDRSSTENISCTLIITNSGGDTTYAATRSTSSPGEAGPLYLEWSSISPSLGIGVISCYMPHLTSYGYSHMATYLVE